jgi:transcription elongation factor Elf1
MPVTETTPFDCPNCGAQYKLVRVETETALPKQKIGCRKCGGPLATTEGPFILKYFFVGRSHRKTSGPRVR